MQILILGSGLMGPAAAYNAMMDPAVTGVTVCDLRPAQLDQCAAQLAGKPGAEKLTYTQLDLNDEPAAAALLSQFDAIVAALPRPANVLAIRAALRAGVPLVDLASVEETLLAQLRREADVAGQLIVLGCGVEPGLTEIMARYLAEKMDRVDELHIKCGGIPEKPAPPLGYKIVFGGRHLPLRDQDATTVIDGQLTHVPRYSGVEPVTFSGVGQCEAWQERFMPWLLDIPALHHLRQGTQKTVRWPGYAAKITVLRELGLLSREPVEVDGVAVIPKHVVDAVLYPKVKLAEGEQDITCFRVEVWGEKDGRPCKHRAEMVDRYDPITGFTSMARTTAFTGAIVARMIASGRLQPGEEPFVTPEQLVTGPLFDDLMTELDAAGVVLELTFNEESFEENK